MWYINNSPNLLSSVYICRPSYSVSSSCVHTGETKRKSIHRREEPRQNPRSRTEQNNINDPNIRKWKLLQD